MSKARSTGPRWYYGEHRHLRASWGRTEAGRRLRSSCQRSRWKSKGEVTEFLVGECCISGKKSWPALSNAIDQMFSQDEDRKAYWCMSAPKCVHMASVCACCAHSRTIC